jgi:glycosyltransferase involved in cell wall biosynthesis
METGPGVTRSQDAADDIQGPDPWAAISTRLGVLQVVPEMRPSGPARAAVDVAAGVVAAGGRAVVVSAGGRLVADLLRCGATHITMPLPADNALGRRAMVRRLVKLILDHRISIVHARMPGAAWLSNRAAEEAGIPYTLTCHGLYEDTAAETRRNRLIEEAAQVIAVSETAADHIMNVHQVQGPPKVITPGIDLARFDPARVSAERIMQVAQAWRLPDGRPIVMLPGRIARSRGHRALIEALSLIAVRDFHCIFAAEDKAGPGYAAELARLAEQHGLESRLVIGEDCRDMAAAYMLADVVVYARADAAGFARVVAEAQAMGRPIVAYDSPLLREHTREARMTWLVPPGDRGALAQSIGEALDLPAAERQILAPEASAIARRRYNHAAAAAAMIEIFVDLLGRAKAA